MTTNESHSKTSHSKRPNWYTGLAPFRKNDNYKASWQLINTLVPYFLLWFVMIRSIQLGYSYLWTLAFAVPAAGLLVRIFTLFHDCVHGSLFKSKKANRVVGYILGVLVFTSFEDWRYTHLQHHATYATLDSRGLGDVWTMTVTEYEEASTMTRLSYRFYRNPLVLVVGGALFNFLLANRIATKGVSIKQRIGLQFTNLCLVGLFLLGARLIGWQTYVLIQLPVLWLAGAGGIWLFYVQHQFEGGYWDHKKSWSSMRAAMEGSSFYKLPAILMWFSCDIGYHHIHHLNAKIPNYNLKKSYEAIPELRETPPLTALKSISCFRLKLWDEKQQKMTAFK